MLPTASNVQPEADEEVRSCMVRKSTIVILVGVVFLFIPIPPIATIIGILTILGGAVLRYLEGS
jgi:hypothetical protein